MATPCTPDQLPLPSLDWRSLLPLTGKANAALARYDGMLQTLPSPSVLLSPITANEAVLSSRIEGTQATLDEVLEHDAGIQVSEARRGDIEEVSNYRAAVRIAEHELTEREITLSLVKSVHQRLMQGVRGRDKTPGQFRSDQNWIGRHGDTIEKARFVPPSPLVLDQALDNWADFISLGTEDPVLQTAIAHAQFEILHPFKDGNGRIGRMLIPLILYKRGTLSRPMFYLSEYLEAQREQYYDKLLYVTRDGDWQGWLEFFIGAVIEQAEANLSKVKKIRDLYDQTRKQVQDVTHSQFAMGSVDTLFANPVIRSDTFRERAGFTNRVTANGMLRQLEGEGIITKIRDASGPNPAIYAMSELINIAEGRGVL